MNDYYSFASSLFIRRQTQSATLSASYQGILKKQNKFGVNLVKNAAFAAWTYSDWEKNEFSLVEPTFSEAMTKTFGDGATPLKKEA